MQITSPAAVHRSREFRLDSTCTALGSAKVSSRLTHISCLFCSAAEYRPQRQRRNDQTLCKASCLLLNVALRHKANTGARSSLPALSREEEIIQLDDFKSHQHTRLPDHRESVSSGSDNNKPRNVIVCTLLGTDKVSL